MCLLTKAAAISLPVRGSPARLEGPEGGGEDAVGGAAAAGRFTSGISACDRRFDLAASRCTVLRQTSTPMSSNATRIASHV